MVQYTVNGKKYSMDSICEMRGKPQQLDVVTYLFKALWIGAINNSFLFNLELETSWGSRVFGDKNIKQDNMKIKGEDLLIAEVCSQSYKFATAVDNFIESGAKEIVLSDSNWKENGTAVLKRIILKEWINRVMTNVKVDGGVDLRENGEKTTVTYDFKLKRGDKEITPKDLTPSEHLVWTLLLLLAQCNRKMNIVFLDLDGVDDSKLIRRLFDFLKELNTKQVTNVVLHIRNNHTDIKIPTVFNV